MQRPLVTATPFLLLIACRPASEPGADAGPDQQVEEREVARGAAGELGKLDVLFVIDNSGSMAEEQQALAAEMPGFLDTLRNQNGDLPSLHVGVITSDMGAGPFGIANCEANGDAGTLQLGAGAGCGDVGPQPYLIDRPTDTGRAGNYTGSLEDAMACMSLQGTQGCGFEQPLEALRTALDHNDANGRFLRDDADLAIVFLTDEDDCSVRNPDMFNPAQNSIDSELGFLTSFRCFEFGVVCEPDDPRAPGEKSGCRPRVDSPYVNAVGDYVDFLRELKGDRRIAVSLIAGDMGPMTVSLEPDVVSGDEQPVLEPSCTGDAGMAVAPIRLGAFAESFALRSRASICEKGYPVALGEVANDLRTAPLCLAGDLADADPQRDGVQPRCSVEQIGPDGAVALLPSCADSSERPCFDLILDATCDGGHLADIRRTALPPSGTEIAVSCDVHVR